MFDSQVIPWYVLLTSGFLIGWGLLTALPNHISELITNQDNFGWWMVVTGVALLVGWFLIPFFPIVWTAIVLMWGQGSATMLAALGIGLVSLVIGGLLVARRRRTNPQRRRK